MTDMIQMIKNTAKWLVGQVGPHRWPGTNGGIIVLAYHRVLPESDPRYALEQPPLCITPETFNRHLNWLKQKGFTLVQLSDWLKGNVADAANLKCCAITFDDGWVDNYEFAYPILKDNKAPATIFCVSSMLAGRSNYWPGRLVQLINECLKHPLPDYQNREEMAWLRRCTKDAKIDWTNPLRPDFDRLIESCKVYSDADIHRHIDDTISALNLSYTEPRQVLTKDQIQEMTSSGLIEIGSHTINHTRLSVSTPEHILHDEIINSRKVLESEFNTPIEIFCYPNGYAPESAQKYVGEAYLAGCGLYKGWNFKSENNSFMARISLHESNSKYQYQFMSRLSGLL